MNPILFLDIDGVLNNGTTREFNRMSQENIEPLNEIIERTSADIVISSSWRILSSMEYIRGHMMSAGFKYPDNVIDMTDFLRIDEGGSIRGQEIKKWLDDHNIQSHYAILDDDETGMELVEDRLVETNFMTGLTNDHVYMVVYLLSG